MSASIPVSPLRAKELIKIIVAAGHVPMLTGQPGASKSDMIRQIAKEMNYFVMDIRLSQYDAVDLSGLPVPNDDEGTFSHLPLDVFPLEGDKIPNGFDGVVLFFDEMNSAARNVQAAAYKIILDRVVGTQYLHEKCVMICAGNREGDGAIVNPQSTAMQSRLVHIEVNPVADDWLKWASSASIDYRIIAFIEQNPRHINDFKPDAQTDSLTFCCPRTLEFASDIIKVLPGEVDATYIPLFTGCLGMGVGMEFVNYAEVFDKIPAREDIMQNPKKALVPTEPSAVYASIALAAEVTQKNNIKGVLKYVTRFPREYQVIYFNYVSSRLDNIRKLPAVSDWILDNLDIL